MNTTRGNVTLTENKRFEVLGLVSIALPAPWWWHAEDINDPGATGAIFRCYEEGSSNEVAYLLIVDVSADLDEPDISTLEDNDILELNHRLESEIRTVLANDGREMIRWMPSVLNRRSFGKAVITTYIGRDQGRDRQYIDVRTRTQNRNVVIGSCFDVNRADQLAKPIWLALNDAIPLGNRL